MVVSAPERTPITDQPSRLARVPVWVWLAGIVVGSCLLRLWLVRRMVAPFIFVDELIYSELAKSLADGDGYAIRGVPTSGYSLLYPALVAPAWGLFDDGVTAYNAAKSINAVAMSLAAIPTYFLAIRVARPSLALLAALTAVVVPSMAYTATITTESLFYPVALALAVALVRYLERPSWRRLGVMFGALAVAFTTRSQAVAFVPAIATAPLLLALVRGGWRDLRRFAPLFAVLGGAFVLLLGLQAARGTCADGSPRCLQHRRRGRVRPRPGTAVLAVACRGVDPLRCDRPGHRARRADPAVPESSMSVFRSSWRRPSR